MSQPTRNIAITAATSKQVTLTLCTANTAALSLTAYPVFSSATSDGTTFYSADRPLRWFTPSTGVFTAATLAATANTAGDGHTVTLTFGQAFAATSVEHVAGATPRRYRYIVHLSSLTPATAYSSAVTSSTAVLLSGTINVAVAPTTPAPAISICDVQVT